MSEPVTLEDLRLAFEIVAALTAENQIYMPVYLRLKQELEQMEEVSALTNRAGRRFTIRPVLKARSS